MSWGKKQNLSMINAQVLLPLILVGHDHMHDSCRYLSLTCEITLSIQYTMPL